MSYICHGTLQHLSVPHQHDLVEEAKRCYGLVPVYATAPAKPVVESWQQRSRLPDGRYHTFGRKDHPGGPLSKPQYDFIIGSYLKGDPELALTLSYSEASAYIVKLKTGTRRPMEPAELTEEQKHEQAKLAMLKPLLDTVKDGYYATRIEEGAPITFLRLARPKKGKYDGATKVQTVHGSGYGSQTRLELAATCWPSGRWTFEHGKAFVKDELFLLCADSFGCQMLYAEKIGKCCRCNAALTDPRSRWNGIGPECEEYWPHILAMVAESKGVWAGQNS
jgi:hypothetical protein